MIIYALWFAFTAVGLSLVLSLWRLLIGPDAGDRVLALDTLAINAVALIVLYGIYSQTQIYFEAALLIAMLGFVSTVAYARFVLRRDVIE
ncbi:MAG: K+/H+ antiporter subunit F [Roseovarius sp.]|nr:K+/H+ antiporter subunit F [Roseovarius sp.]